MHSVQACAPLGTAATEAGLTALVGAITASTPALEVCALWTNHVQIWQGHAV